MDEESKNYDEEDYDDENEHKESLLGHEHMIKSSKLY